MSRRNVREMRDPYPKHGPRRRWFAPWRVICRCGLAAYPCIVMRTLRIDPAAGPGDVAAWAQEIYADGLAEAKRWQADERRRWAGGR
jgi:hypothetical protein